MPVAAVAHFASRRSNLTIIERGAQPQYEGGRLIGTEKGRYHEFSDHRIRVEGQKTIDYLRSRAVAVDGPEIWEIDATDIPNTTDLLSELATADVARVREILAAEQETAQRDAVIGTCQAVLAKMGAAERGPGGKTV